MPSLWLAATTTTTVFDPHRGTALPFARVVVIAVPTGAFLVYAFLSSRKRSRRS